MATNTANRKTARVYLAGLLSIGLAGAEQVYSYKKGEFTASPVVLVYAANTTRQNAGLGPGQSFDNAFEYYVEVWVVDADTAGGWTEQNVEDALDDLGKAIADIIGDNRQATGYWDEIDFTPAPSVIFEVTTKGGQSYVAERHFVRAVTYNK